jgi:lambda family phage portal protein
VKFLDLFRKKPTTTIIEKPTMYIPYEGYSYERQTGSKYYNGFGETKIYIPDYFTMRVRSEQLYKENIYARGIIWRLVTNIINTGLTPEVQPIESVLGVPDGSLGDWSELVEDRFSIWGTSKKLSDTTRQRNFWKLQQLVKLESLVVGDVLVVLRLDRVTGLPRVQLISGTFINTPPGMAITKSGNRIIYGVELNQFNQQVAYHVTQLDRSSIRIPAVGAKSGRQVAWLVYGTERKLNEVRGEPFLSLAFQSLKEIDRYRDATQRKAAINAMIALFMKKTQDKMGSKPITGAAVRKTKLETTGIDGVDRKYNIANQIPGLVMEELQYGEEPVAFGNQGTDTNFSDFESAIIHGIAWAFEIPPEILELSFASNYSASQAAINEFKMFLNRVRSDFGADFCDPIYQEWLISEVLNQRIKAPGFLESWRDPLQFDIYGAWVTTEWSGAIKPSTDIKKQAQGYELMIGNAWITNARAAKELAGTKFRRNIRTIKRENEEKEEAGLTLPALPAASIEVPKESAGDSTEDADENNTDEES